VAHDDDARRRLLAAPVIAIGEPSAAAARDAGFTLLFTSEPTAAAVSLGTITVNGRFTIHRWTAARTVAALATGAWVPCTRQALLWSAKKMGKRVGGAWYLHVRKLLLGHGE